jgi:hypothetical protein
VQSKLAASPSHAPAWTTGRDGRRGANG